MCDPVSLGVAGLALSGTTAVVSGAQQSSAARAQNRYQGMVYRQGQLQYDQELGYRDQLTSHQEEMFTENALSANENAIENYREIQERIGQDAVVAAMEINNIVEQSREATASTVANAGERGVEGASVNVLLDNIKSAELGASENIRMEQGWRLDGMMGMMDEVEAQTQARINSMTPNPIPLPALPAPMAPKAGGGEWLTALLNLGANSLNVMSNYYDQTKMLQKPAPVANPTAANMGSRGMGPNWTSGYGYKGYKPQSWVGAWGGRR